MYNIFVIRNEHCIGLNPLMQTAARKGRTYQKLEPAIDALKRHHTKGWVINVNTGKPVFIKGFRDIAKAAGIKYCK